MLIPKSSDDSSQNIDGGSATSRTKLIDIFSSNDELQKQFETLVIKIKKGFPIGPGEKGLNTFLKYGLVEFDKNGKDRYGHVEKYYKLTNKGSELFDKITNQ